MAKITMLGFVQQIAEAIESDEIDTLDETLEASAIMTILEQTYSEVLDRRDWEFIRDRVVQLDERDAADVLQINQLRIPPNVTAIQCLRYLSKEGKYTDLTYMQPCDFIAHLHGRNQSDDTITTVINDDGVPMFIHNHIAPTRYTSFDEESIAFDAFETVRGVGNQIADTVIVGNVKPVPDFTNPAAFLPIPERMFSLILNEAIATANYRLRQTQDPRSERLARRQNIKMRELEPKTQRDNQEVHYGRRTRSGR